MAGRFRSISAEFDFCGGVNGAVRSVPVRKAARGCAAGEINTPVFSRVAPRQQGELPPDLVVCAWKQADYSDATVARIYNPTGRTIAGALSTGASSADEVDFREDHTGDLAVENGTIALVFQPYEIKTVRIER